MTYYTNDNILMILRPEEDRFLVSFIVKEGKQVLYMNKVQVWEYMKVNGYREAREEEVAIFLLQTLH